MPNMLLTLIYISAAIFVAAAAPHTAFDSSTLGRRQADDFAHMHVSNSEARSTVMDADILSQDPGHVPLPPTLPDDVSFHLDMSSPALSGERLAAVLPLKTNETGATSAEGGATRTVGPGPEGNVTTETFYSERGTKRLYLLSDDGRRSRLYAFFDEGAPTDELGFNRAHFIDSGVKGGYYVCEITSQRQLACHGAEGPEKWVEWRLKDTTVMADRGHNSGLPLVELHVKDLKDDDTPH